MTQLLFLSEIRMLRYVDFYRLQVWANSIVDCIQVLNVDLYAGCVPRLCKKDNTVSFCMYLLAFFFQNLLMIYKWYMYY